jgi:transcriptional regulator with XRE-family HTH domain
MVAFGYNQIMETLGSRLRYARNARGVSQQIIADHLGIDRVNISTWESDQTRPDVSRISAIAKFYGASEAWLLSGEGEAPIKSEGQKKLRATHKTAAVPGGQLLGTGKMPLYAGAMGGDGHVIVTFDAIDYVKRPAELENVKGGYGLLIVGESMIPAFWPGDMALVNPHLTPARQKNVILYHTPPNGGEVEAMVKQLEGWTPKEWHLKQWNPMLEFSEFRQEWPVCHRVVGKYDAR